MHLHKLFPILAVAYTLQSPADAASLVRLACDGDAEGAIVRVDGRVLGECPLDARVEAGTHEFRAVKPFGQFKEQVFTQKITVGDGVSKRIEVVLGAPQWTAEGQRLENARVRAIEDGVWQKAEAAKSLDDYRAYLKQYPQGNYAAQALTRIRLATAPQDDAAWVQAEQSNTLWGYKTYVRQFPQGARLDQARERAQKIESDFPPLPARPKLPFEISEEVWQQLESSNLYRMAPKPKSFTVRYKILLDTKYTGSELTGFFVKQPDSLVLEEVREFTPVSEKCFREIYRQSVGTSREVYETYYCGAGLINLGTLGAGGKYRMTLTRVDQLEGNLFPLRIGASLIFNQHAKMVIEGNESNISESLQGVVTEQIPAQQLDPRWQGSAWNLGGKYFFLDVMGVFRHLLAFGESKEAYKSRLPTVGEKIIDENKDPKVGSTRTNTVLEFSLTVQ